MPIIDRIRARGGDVIREDCRFRLRRGQLTPEAVEWVRAHWRDVCAEVWPPFPDWEERAAIREFDGGQDRETAEREAYKEVLARC